MTVKLNRKLANKLIISLFCSLLKCQLLVAQATINSSDNITSLTYLNSNYPGWEDGINITGANTTVSISGNFVLDFNDLSEISVDQGCKLILENCTLTCSQFPSSHFYGINGLGISNEEQFSTFPNIVDINDPNLGDPTNWSGVLNTSQTSIKIDNVLFENCDQAVKSQNGCIVRIRSSEFRNCILGVSILNYESQSNPNFNASYVMSCVFNWSSSNPNISPDKHVYIKEIKGVQIGGNVFKNNSSLRLGLNGRGRGIYSINSSFFAGHDGDRFVKTDDCLDIGFLNDPSNGNVFENLTHGIEAYNFEIDGSNNIILKYTNTAVVRDNDFKDCLTELCLAAGKYHFIFKNNFESDIDNLDVIFNPSLGATLYFELKDNLELMTSSIIDWDNMYSPIRMGQVSNIIYYKNNHLIKNNADFYKFLALNELWNTTSNDGSLILNNIFESATTGSKTTDAAEAIHIAEFAPAVGIRCNKFSNFGTDIFISNGVNSTSLSTNCDNPLSRPGLNEFSLALTGRHNINNESVNFNTYHYQNSTDNPSVNGYPINKVSCLNTHIESCELDCDATIGRLTHIRTIGSIPKNHDLIVSPNPSQQVFSISNKSKDTPKKVEVLDYYGRQIYISNWVDLDGSMQLDINLLPGTYLLQVYYDNEKLVRVIMRN